MIQTLESTVMDRRIWGQIVEWLQIPEIQVAIFFIVEFGDTFLLEQFYLRSGRPRCSSRAC